MSTSSFQYDWENVSSVIRKIYEVINFNEYGCDLYTMDYISQMLTHFSKFNRECVHQFTKIHLKQINGLIFSTKLFFN